MTTAMQARPEFGKPTRKFEMTVSLQEGYDGGRVHEISEVFALIKSFATEFRIEFGCEVLATTVTYSYLNRGEMVVLQEPGVKLVGLFPPNKFGDHSDEQLAEMVGRLAAHLAGPLGQTSFHAEVCGIHHSWKRSGSLTAHEMAQKESQ